jgi:hypothetical protein
VDEEDCILEFAKTLKKHKHGFRINQIAKCVDRRAPPALAIPCTAPC